MLWSAGGTRVVEGSMVMVIFWGRYFEWMEDENQNNRVNRSNL